MRITHLVALLTGAIVYWSAATGAHARIYTKEEFEWLAHTLWHEGGSTDATPEELRNMAHSIVVRSQFEDWYQRKDFGGPNIVSVVQKKENGVCQYSYFCTSHAHEKPISGNLWGTIKCKLESIPAKVSEKPTSCELWERSKQAAQEVLDGWKPEGEMARADTYWHKCGAGFAVENCSPKFMASERTKCWFKLEQVLIDGQTPIPENWKHVFFRRKTLDEVKATISDVPPGCENHLDTVGRVHEAQQEWVDYPDARPFVVKPPVLKQRHDRKHKKAAL